MTLKWSDEKARRGGPGPHRDQDADKPRKLRGSERPGHEHENALVIGMLVAVAALAALAFAWWIAPYEPGGGDGLTPEQLGVFLFAVAVLLLVAMALWLFFDFRTPILIMSGPIVVGLILGSAGSPLVLVILPGGLCFAWAGLAALDRHRIDRWVAVVVAVVLTIAFGSFGILAFSPVAIVAALVPMLRFGPEEEAAESEVAGPDVAEVGDGEESSAAPGPDVPGVPGGPDQRG